jgi:8-oxo-dGTP diphosphatase
MAKSKRRGEDQEPTAEEAFLSAYDATVFPRPSVAVDLVVTSVDAEGRLLVLLIKRRDHPFKGGWSLPGGFLRENEGVPEAAARVVREKTSLEGLHPEEIGSFSAPGRDPRGWIIALGHLALVPADQLDRVRAGGAAEDARFWVVEGSDDPRGFRLLPRSGKDTPPSLLAFDHDAVLARGLSLLRSRVESTTLAFGLLPEKFSLPEAQRVVEAILGRKLDRAAFRTKVLSLGLVRPTTEERRGFAHRPARLYTAASGWHEPVLFSSSSSSRPRLVPPKVTPAPCPS